jgi:2-hydroxy-6-oxonona-2,4-dienedioate hydrolase
VAALAAAGAWALWRLASAAARQGRAYRRDAARLRDAWVEVGGHRLRARVADDAPDGRPPIVFVHGLGVSSAYWVPLAARLARTHRVYVPDLAGHGPAEHPDEGIPPVEGMAEGVVDWLDALGLRRAVLVGNSMGCQVAAEVAARHPERVAALVLVGPTVDPEGRGFLRQAARLAASAPHEDASLDALVVRDYVRMGPRLLADELRAMLAHRIERVLPLVEAPTLVVRGEHDRVAPARWAAEAARLAGGGWVEIPDAGHAVHFDRPDRVAAVIRGLLRGV